MSELSEADTILLEVANNAMELFLDGSNGAPVHFTAGRLEAQLGAANSKRAVRLLAVHRESCTHSLRARCEGCYDFTLNVGTVQSPRPLPDWGMCEVCGTEMEFHEEDVFVDIWENDPKRAYVHLRDDASNLARKLRDQGMADVAIKAEVISEELHQLAFPVEDTSV